jgi:exonuclease SbcC
MQILSLRLDNTKSYRHAQINFADGVNAVVGHNGAGKSTILEAIGFALFDALDYKHEEFVREDADTAEITVDFHSDRDSRTYRVVRRCGSSTQYRVFDVETELKVCEGKADVVRFLRQQMGVDAGSDLAALFRDAVGVPQGTFTAIFLEPASKRKPTFDRLLQVEEYGRAAERLREPARLLRERQQALDVQLAALGARLEQLDPLEQIVAQRQQQIKRGCNEVERTEQQLSIAEARRSVLEQLQQQVQNLRARQSQLASLAENLGVQVTAAQAALAQAEQARRTVAEHQTDHDHYKEAQELWQELERQLQLRQNLERVRAEVDKSLAQSQTMLAAVEHELNAVAAAEQTLAALAAPLAQQEQLETTLALAQQQCTRLEDARRQVDTHETQTSRLQMRLADLTTQLAQIARLEERTGAIDEQIARLRQRIDTAKEQQIACKNSADTLRKQNEALADVTTARCPVCEQMLSEDHRQAMLQRNEERLQTLRGEYKGHTDQLRSDESLLKQQESERQQTQQQLLRLPRSEERERVEQELAQASAAHSVALQLVAELAGAPQQVAALTSQLTALENPRQQYAVAGAAAARRPALEQQQQHALAEQAVLNAKLNELQAQMAAFAELDATVETIRANLLRWEPAYHVVLTNRQLAATVEERSVEVARSTMLQSQMQAEVRQVEAELVRVSAGFDPAAFQQVLDEVQQLRASLTRLQTELRMWEQQQVTDRAQITTLHQVQKEHTDLEAKKTRLGKQDETLDAMRDLLKRAGPQVTRALIQQVSRSADQVFCDMMQDYTRRLTWNEDYGITLEVAGRSRQFAQLSGGEQMCAALAVRLALLHEMTNIDIAFFDEPTTNLDETRRDSLVRQILDIRGLRQLFVISHDDTFEQATQNLVRVQRIDGVSVIVSNE